MPTETATDADKFASNESQQEQSEHPETPQSQQSQYINGTTATIEGDIDEQEFMRRIMSSQSLVGEELLASSRLVNSPTTELSPFTPTSEATTTPSIILKLKTSLSLEPPPPPMSSSMDGGGLDNSLRSTLSLRQTSFTRPPRIPSTAGKQQPPNPQTISHSRGHSHSDYSTLSALTDNSWESNNNNNAKQASQHSRRPRTKSLGDANNYTANSPHTQKSTPVNLLQPILMDHDPSPPASIFTPASIQRFDNNNRKQQWSPPSIDPILLGRSPLSSVYQDETKPDLIVPNISSFTANTSRMSSMLTEVSKKLQQQVKSSSPKAKNDRTDIPVYHFGQPPDAESISQDEEISYIAEKQAQLPESPREPGDHDNTEIESYILKHFLGVDLVVQSHQSLLLRITRLFMAICLGTIILCHFILEVPTILAAAGEISLRTMQLVCFLGIYQPVLVEVTYSLESRMKSYMIGGWHCLLGVWSLLNLIGTEYWFYSKSSPHLTRLLACMLGLSIAAGMKRFLLKYILVTQLIARHHDEVESVLNQLRLISQVTSMPNIFDQPEASFGKKENKSAKSQYQTNQNGATHHHEKKGISSMGSFDYSEGQSTSNLGKQLQQQQQQQKSNKSSQRELFKMLQEWDKGDELREENRRGNEVISSKRIAQFHHSVSQLLSDRYAFSNHINLFSRSLSSPRNDRVLLLDTLCHWKDKQDIDPKEFIVLFRPSRKGELTRNEFLKSIDSVYQSRRILLASIKNVSQIHQSFELIVSAIFYAVLFMIIAGIILEIDAMIISISVTAILVSLVVLVGFSSTLSRFLEGVLFVLIRKPYDIGDAVEIQSFTMPGATTCLLYPYGCWIVENVNLSSTTLRNDSTREVATIANGTMFQARIITRTRLEYSSVCMRFPFPVLSNNKQVERFREKLSDFLHARPREWVCLSSFVCNCQVEAGFMEYILIVIHREPWRNEKVIMESKGRLLCYCLQVQKDLAIIRQTTAPH